MRSTACTSVEGTSTSASAAACSKSERLSSGESGPTSTTTNPGCANRRLVVTTTWSPSTARVTATYALQGETTPGSGTFDQSGGVAISPGSTNRTRRPEKSISTITARAFPAAPWMCGRRA